MSIDRQSAIARVIEACQARPGRVLVGVAVLMTLAIIATLRLPVDALPDLSDVQVIVRTPFAGQSPQIVEDQVTYPLATALRAVPGATAVRAYSLFGESLVYVLFADGTDTYWARSRVLESLAGIGNRLPSGVQPTLGPDATGVGWIYEYAVIDRTGRHDLGQLSALTRWHIGPELQSIPGVAEVATIGGMVSQYQVIPDPDQLRARGITLAQLRTALARGNRETGGGAIEVGEAEVMIRASGYVRSIADLEAIPLNVGSSDAPLRVGDIAEVRRGPEMRRGLADLDGRGEVVGGVVVARASADVRETIRAVRARIAELHSTLPAGVEIVETYDRSGLIDRALGMLRKALAEEIAIILVVCGIFLWHVRAALAIASLLPLTLLSVCLVMGIHGLTANIMSLGGIAIALGALADAAIVMTENAYRRLVNAGAGRDTSAIERRAILKAACVEVGPALVASLLVAALSFLPVLAVDAPERRLFAPLVWTKTYAMLAAAVLSVTLVPVMIWLCVRGRLYSESENPVTRACAAAYRPVLDAVLRSPRAAVVIAAALALLTVWPALRLDSEFMPDLDEGDLLFMPTTAPNISPEAVRSLLRATDAAIREVPEVASVFGKAGRAETATDPAPLEMIETVVRLRPRDEWRAGMTPEKLRAELTARVQAPGISTLWLHPIRSRIDMLSTGVRTPLGIRVTGPDWQVLDRLAPRIEHIVRAVPGAGTVYAERAEAARYVQIDVDRERAARFGLNIADVHEVVDLAIAGSSVGETIEGRERYPITLRYPAAWRDSPDRLRDLPFVTEHGQRLTLGDVADVRLAPGAGVLRSEDARPSLWIYIAGSDRDVRSFIADARARIDAADILPAGYRIEWTGQFESLERMHARLGVVIPLVLAVIALLLSLALNSFRDVLIVLGVIPGAIAGAIWFIWLLDYRWSAAVIIGVIALAGIAAETGIVMLLYLNQAVGTARDRAGHLTAAALHAAVVDGALLRLRPKLMTVTTIIAGLLPLMLSSDTGSEVMRRIAAPMLGGMLTTLLITLLVVPALYLLARQRETREVTSP